ncbi:MAG TPA: hypothetical protein VGC90_00410 [Candidatus Limnocylindrales bacterium]|jgi:hypothetical protein
MHKLVGPVPRLDPSAGLTIQEPLRVLVTRAGRTRIDAAAAAIGHEIDQTRTWWGSSGRDTLMALIVGPPTPVLARASPTGRGRQPFPTTGGRLAVATRRSR